jgi:hypothetical protein
VHLHERSGNEESFPGILKLRKGKSCFHIKKLDDGLRKDIAAVLESGEKNYKERGWL